MEDFIQLEPHYFWEVRNGGPPLFGTLGPIGATARTVGDIGGPAHVGG